MVKHVHHSPSGRGLAELTADAVLSFRDEPDVVVQALTLAEPQRLRTSYSSPSSRATVSLVFAGSVVTAPLVTGFVLDGGFGRDALRGSATTPG